MIPVLLFNYSNAPGGAEKSLLDILTHLDKRRFAPILLVFGSGPLAEAAEAQNVPVVRIPAGDELSRFTRSRLFFSLMTGLRQFPVLCRQVLAVRRVIRSRGIRLIHSNNPKSHVFAALASAGIAIPCLFHMRDIFPAGSFAFNLLGWIGAWKKPRVIAISESVRRALPPSLRQRASVVYNGFRLPVIRLNRQSIRRAYGVGEQEALVVSAGRIVPWKGWDLLIEALTPTVNTKPCCLLIAGDALYGDEAYFEKLKNRVQRSGAAGRILFTGFLEDLESVLCAADLFVLASENEPFGRVLVEAMSCGIPCAAFRSGGPVEIIEDGRTGLLIETRKPRQLRSAVEYLLEDEEKRKTLGEAGRVAVRRRFPLNTMIQAVQAVYGECVEPSV